MITTEELLKRAKAAAPSLRSASTEGKNAALLAMADALLEREDDILAQNTRDMERAKDVIPEAMMDRLLLTKDRIEDMAKGVRDVAALPDPVGVIQKEIQGPDKLLIQKKSVPLGLVAIIYESRPNVTSDAAALCIKSGNACILRGGKEAFYSANAICEALKEGLKKAGMSEDLIELVQDTSRKSATELMTATGYVDLLIPRGGAGLIRSCVENATVECIKTGTGICHVYVDAAADQDMALRIIENAKASRPSVCNAEEVCLVHKDIAPEFLPKLKRQLIDERKKAAKPPVQLRLDERAADLLKKDKSGEEDPCLLNAGPDDFDTEFLDYILAVKVVDSIEEAIAHIAEHSTGHSDAIVTEDDAAADAFVNAVDSAAVYVNASTRFTDGGQFGLGCEMGISTQKLPPRGPMGLEELTTYKYVVHGKGNIR